MNVTSFLREGENEIELEGSVGIEPEPENLFLVGDFGVELASKGASIVEEHILKETSNLVSQGYPFYVGSFELSNEFSFDEEVGDRIVALKLRGLRASLSVVHINNQEAGKVFMHPFSLDVIKFIKKGKKS